MGLAEPKRKKRLAPSHNAHSTWSKSTAESSLGFKLMSSMGWAPGHGLGQDLQGEKDNVKYSLKDDLLGVGAKKEYGGGLWRGTSEIDDLYKRLEVGAKMAVTGGMLVEEKAVEEKVKMRGGWAMRFQVGDTYTSSFSRDESETEVSTPVQGAVEEAEVKQKKSKKRKREGEKEEKRKKLKKIKGGKETESEENATPESELPTVEDVIPGEGKPKKDKGKKDKSKKESKEKLKKQSKEEPTTADSDMVQVVDQKKEKRKDKKAHKDSEDKPAEDKAEKPTSKKDKETASKKDKNGSSKQRKDKATSETAVSSAPSANPSSHEATPISDSDGPSKSSRHMHRARFMAMKKASVLNPDALREILGVSA